MTAPLVSVVMPTYQRSDYLVAALDSALAQTFRDFELIVTDNGPSDEVRALVEGYGDSRVRYRHNGSNIGPMGNVMAAEQECKTDLLAVLHDDNLWEPTFLERLATPLLDDPDVVLSFCDHFLVDARGEVDLARTESNTRLWGRAGLRAGVHVPFRRLAVVDRAVAVHVAVIHRRSALDWGHMPAEVEMAYDLWSAYLMSRSGAPAYYVPDRLVSYRLHDGSLSSNYQLNESLFKTYARMVDDPALAEVRPGVLRRVTEFRTAFGIDLLCRQELLAARRQLRQAMRERVTASGLGALALSYLPQGARLARVLRRRRLGLRPLT